MTQASRSLVALPTELLEAIAYFLPSEDVCTLRLTCFTIARKIEHHFTRTYYKHAGFLVNSFGSIKLAIDFAQHPTVGPAIQEITFFVDLIPNPWTTAEPCHIESTDRLMMLRWLRSRFWKDSKPFANFEARQQALELLFRELKVHGQLSRINFADVHSTTQVPVFDKGEIGPSIANISTMMRDVLPKHLTANRDIETTLEAMFNVGMPSIQSIKARGPWICLRQLLPYQLHTYEQAFASLRRLSLHLDGRDLESWTSNAQDFAKALATSHSLESLEIRLAVRKRTVRPSRIFDSPFSAALLEANFPSIKVLILCMVETLFGTLLSFVHRHRSLEGLILRECLINSVSFHSLVPLELRVDMAIAEYTHLEHVITDDFTENFVRRR
ncbi:hypothetical protein PRZ48_013872 [Zasmidium cellare]|uniref:F-box domain-containing protein n=1 Tax=Zasmidium cellare TaxID=395010 RepID=A0ABR0E2B3_ZASCE|nr:hypothetical protein PRZ48_013872 [Zasmidium cellare]